MLALFSFCLLTRRWLSPCRVAGLERSVGSRCRQNEAGLNPDTDCRGLTGYTSPDFKASISGQTHCGDPKLAPCGVSCLIVQRQYFWFSKELRNLKCIRQKVGLRQSDSLSRLGYQLYTLTRKALFVRFGIYYLSEALITRFLSFSLTGLFSNLSSYFLFPPTGAK